MRRPVVILALLGVVVLGLGGGLYLFLNQNSPKSQPEVQPAASLQDAFANSTPTNESLDSSNEPQQPEVDADTPADKPSVEKPDPLAEFRQHDEDEDEEEPVKRSLTLSEDQLEKVNQQLDEMDLTDEERQAKLGLIKKQAEEHGMLVMPTQVCYQGIVLDHEGKPVSSAFIYAVISFKAPASGKETTYSPIKLNGPTDWTGNFTIWEETGSVYRFNVQLYTQTRNGLKGPAKEFAAEAGRFYQDIELRMPKGACIKGVVVDQATVPVSRAKVFAYDSNDGKAPLLKVTADKDGKFELQGLPKGEYRLFAAKDGYEAKEAGYVKVKLTEDQTLELQSDVVLQTKTAIRFKLTCNGKPLTGKVLVHGNMPDDLLLTKIVTCDQDGVALIALEPWRETIYDIRVFKDGYKPSKVVLVTVLKDAHCDAGKIELEPDPDKK